MKGFVFVTLRATVAMALAMLMSAAHAQATRTWVSGVGDDANPCSRTAPCKTFAGAISKTAAGGEISALDPAGYGAVTITKSITISGDNTLAGILNAGTNGIIINAAATDVVHLRSISIQGVGSALNGIRVLAAGAVYIDGVSIADQTTSGIDIAVNQATPAQVSVRNSTIRNVSNGTASAIGVNVANAGTGAVSVLVENSQLQGVNTAIAAGARASVMLSRSNVTGGGTAVSVTTATATVRLSDSTITANTTGLANPGAGQIISHNNNRLQGNGTDGAPTSTVYQR